MGRQSRTDEKTDLVKIWIKECIFYRDWSLRRASKNELNQHLVNHKGSPLEDCKKKKQSKWIVGRRGLTQVDKLPGVLLRVDGEGAEGEVVQTAPIHNQQVSRRSHHLFLGGQSSQ